MELPPRHLWTLQILLVPSGEHCYVNRVYYYAHSNSLSGLGLSWDQLKPATGAGEDLISWTVITGNLNTLDASTLEVYNYKLHRQG